MRDAVFFRLGVLPTDDLESDLDFVRETYSLLETSKSPWEPFFHKWFGGAARDATPEDFEEEWMTKISTLTPDRPERLGHTYFKNQATCDLLYDEIEEIWDAIDADDNWTPFERKLAEIETVRESYQ